MKPRRNEEAQAHIRLSNHRKKRKEYVTVDCDWKRTQGLLITDDILSQELVYKYIPNGR
jgi:hypothetical protein